MKNKIINIEHKVFYVYEYINPITKLRFYIGEGTGNRKNFHWKEFLRYVNYNEEEKIVNEKNYKRLKRSALNNIFKYRELKSIYNAELVPIVNVIIDKLCKENSVKIQDIFINRFGTRFDNTGILCNIIKDSSNFVKKWKEKEKKIKNGTFWVNNGIENKKINKNQEISKGFMRGRLNICNGKPFTAKDCIYITNGKDNMFVNKNEKISEGYWRGQTRERKNKWITNGITTKAIPKDQEIPKGWRKGTSFKTPYKKTNLGRIYITNGIVNKFIDKEKDIPIGWKRGQSRKNQKGRHFYTNDAGLTKKLFYDNEVLKGWIRCNS